MAWKLLSKVAGMFKPRTTAKLVALPPPSSIKPVTKNAVLAFRRMPKVHRRGVAPRPCQPRHQPMDSAKAQRWVEHFRRDTAKLWKRPVGTV